MSTEFLGISCPVCFEVFDSEKAVPFVFSCGHGICVLCNESKINNMKTCPTCRKPIIARAKNFAYVEALKNFGNVHRKIEDLKNPDINHQCSECQKWTLRKNMHICKTCTIEGGLLNLTEVAEEERSKKVVEVSMCSNCIAPLHAYKGHRMVAMIPIYNEHHFTPDLSVFELRWEDFKNSLDDLALKKTYLTLLSCQVELVHSWMTLTARNSETENLKKRILKKRNKFMDKAISFCEAADTELERNPIDIQSRFTYSSTSLNLETKLDDFRHSFKMLNMSFTVQHDALSELGDENHARFFAMARRSKSRAQQDEVFEKMDEFIDEATKIHEGIESMLEERAKIVEEASTKLRDWLDARPNNCGES